jgi:hypothetical protein
MEILIFVLIVLATLCCGGRSSKAQDHKGMPKCVAVFRGDKKYTPSQWSALHEQKKKSTTKLIKKSR